MEGIKLATPEEVEAIRATSDLDFAQAIFEWDGNRVVFKLVPELDPIYFKENEAPSKKAMFVWGLEERLKGMGYPAYYFNIHESDQAWQHIAQKWGAEKISTAPESRFKKVLVKVK